MVNWLIFLKLYISDTGNEAILEGVKITGNGEDLYTRSRRTSDGDNCTGELELHPNFITGNQR